MEHKSIRKYFVFVVVTSLIFLWLLYTYPVPETGVVHTVYSTSTLKANVSAAISRNKQFIQDAGAFPNERVESFASVLFDGSFIKGVHKEFSENTLGGKDNNKLYFQLLRERIKSQLKIVIYNLEKIENFLTLNKEITIQFEENFSKEHIYSLSKPDNNINTKKIFVTDDLKIKAIVLSAALQQNFQNESFSVNSLDPFEEKVIKMVLGPIFTIERNEKLIIGKQWHPLPSLTEIQRLDSLEEQIYWDYYNQAASEEITWKRDYLLKIINQNYNNNKIAINLIPQSKSILSYFSEDMPVNDFPVAVITALNKINKILSLENSLLDEHVIIGHLGKTPGPQLLIDFQLAETEILNGSTLKKYSDQDEERENRKKSFIEKQLLLLGRDRLVNNVRQNQRDYYYEFLNNSGFIVQWATDKNIEWPRDQYSNIRAIGQLSKKQHGLDYKNEGGLNIFSEIDRHQVHLDISPMFNKNASRNNGQLRMLKGIKKDFSRSMNGLETLSFLPSGLIALPNIKNVKQPYYAMHSHIDISINFMGELKLILVSPEYYHQYKDKIDELTSQMDYQLVQVAHEEEHLLVPNFQRLTDTDGNTYFILNHAPKTYQAIANVIGHYKAGKSIIMLDKAMTHSAIFLGSLRCMTNEYYPLMGYLLAYGWGELEVEVVLSILDRHRQEFSYTELGDISITERGKKLLKTELELRKWKRSGISNVESGHLSERLSETFKRLEDNATAHIIDDIIYTQDKHISPADYITTP